MNYGKLSQRIQIDGLCHEVTRILVVGTCYTGLSELGDLYR
jgi:hypothetical protein